MGLHSHGVQVMALQRRVGKFCTWDSRTGSPHVVERQKAAQNDVLSADGANGKVGRAREGDDLGRILTW